MAYFIPNYNQHRKYRCAPGPKNHVSDTPKLGTRRQKIYKLRFMNSKRKQKWKRINDLEESGKKCYIIEANKPYGGKPLLHKCH